MAIMMPAFLPSNPRPTQGEVTLYKILESNLTDDFWVWYEPVVGGKYPDFIVLSPNLGLIILEVKDWSIKNIFEATSKYFKVSFDNK
jgi:hypothetical protein